MRKITVNNVLEATNQTAIYDIANAIRNSSSQAFRDAVPLANALNVAEWGTALRLNQQFMNEFANALVNRIGAVVFKHVQLSNPLARFKQNHMLTGDTIEEIFTDLATEHFYDVDVAEEEVFKRELPNIEALYHKRNRQGFYKVTISDTQLAAAFTSWEQVGTMLAQAIQSLYNGASVGEYEYMLLLLKNYYAKGHFKVFDLGSESSLTPKMLVEKARGVATSMTLPMGTSKYNSLGVRTTTTYDDLLIFMTPETEASIDVNVLAAAFNMDKAQFLGNRIIVDDLGSNPENPSEKIHMIIADQSLFVVRDTLNRMTSQYNAQGLYTNYFLHVQQVQSTSRFANAVAITTGATKPVTEVIVKPAVTAVKIGKEYPITTHIRTVDGLPFTTTDVTYTFKDGDTLADYDGLALLTDGDNGEKIFVATPSTPKHLILIASVVIDAETNETVEGRAFINVADTPL